MSRNKKQPLVILQIEEGVGRLSLNRPSLNIPNAEHVNEMISQYLEDLMSTADVHEGLTAYKEKRSLNWLHR